ncbi:hypothetical protein BDY19DRAFT_973393, partial [Irpex rosettiformis]
MHLLKLSKHALLQVDTDKLKISCEVSASKCPHRGHRSRSFMLASAYPSLHLRITYHFAPLSYTAHHVL